MNEHTPATAPTPSGAPADTTKALTSEQIDEAIWDAMIDANLSPNFCLSYHATLTDFGRAVWARAVARASGELAELRWIVNGFLEWQEGSPCPAGLIERARNALAAPQPSSGAAALTADELSDCGLLSELHDSQAQSAALAGAPAVQEGGPK